MSAQAVQSGLPAPAASSRPQGSGGSQPDRSDSSFGDTLDEASRASDTQPRGDGATASERAGERRDGERSMEHDGDDAAVAEGGGRTQRGDGTGVIDISAMLAAIGVAATGSEGARDGASRAGPPTPTTGLASAQSAQESLWMPGQAADGGEADASKLIALLDRGATGEARPQVPVDTVDVDVSYAVKGSETHLARETAAAKAMVALSTAGQTDTQHTESAADLLLANAARAARAGSEADEGATKGDTGSSARGAVLVAETDGQVSAALAGRDVSKQNGGSSEGHGGSGTGSQPQGAATFQSALAAASARTAEQFAETVDAPDEPVSQQIASEVRAELKADGLGDVSSDGVLKVLNIELKPANLGSVTVRLALKDNAITVHLETQRRDTLAAIEKEREALVGALSAAGYSVDGITTAAQSDWGRSQGALSTIAGASAPAPQGGMQGQAGQSFGNAPGGQGQSGAAGGGQAGYRPPSDDNDASNGGVRKGADGLYV